MLTPLPFALQASSSCVPHAELALSLAAAFHPVDAGLVDERIERLSALLVLDVAATPADELSAVAEVLRDPRAPRSAERHDVRGLMLDDALDRGVAHPLIRAIIAVEVGRRHGIELGVVSNGSQHCVGHLRLDEPLLLRGDTGAVVDAHTLSETLQWQCSHETCGLLIDELEDRWLTWTRIDRAIQVAQLRLRLPLDASSEQAAQVRLERVRARLN